MADMNTQQQDLTLTGGNDATNRLTNYYNQIKTQLSQSAPSAISAQVITLPREMQAQQIAAPTPIQAERIDYQQRDFGQYADELSSYLSKYLDNSIAARNKKLAEERALVDIDANSRGITPSTWTTDAKLRLSNQAASDIMAARNEFLGRIGELAYNSAESDRNRGFQAAQFNANAANEIALQNAANELAVQQYNANALMNTDEFNIENLINIAMQNAVNQLTADRANTELLQTLEQLAWNRAGQLYDTNPITNTVYQEGPTIYVAEDPAPTTPKTLPNPVTNKAKVTIGNTNSPQNTAVQKKNIILRKE